MVTQDDSANLPYLIHLRMFAVTLEVDSFLDFGPPEYVMACPRAFLKTELEQEVTKIIESDVGVSLAPEEPIK